MYKRAPVSSEWSRSRFARPAQPKDLRFRAHCNESIWRVCKALRRCVSLSSDFRNTRKGIMRFRFACASLAFLCSSLVATGQTSKPTCAELHVVPALRECTSMHSIPIGDSGVLISSAKESHDAAEFAIKDLEETLPARGVKVANHGSSVTIGFSLTSAENAKRLLQDRHLEFTAAMRDEGYVIAPMGETAMMVLA